MKMAWAVIDKRESIYAASTKKRLAEVYARLTGMKTTEVPVDTVLAKDNEDMWQVKMWNGSVLCVKCFFRDKSDLGTKIVPNSDGSVVYFFWAGFAVDERDAREKASQAYELAIKNGDVKRAIDNHKAEQIERRQAEIKEREDYKAVYPDRSNTACHEIDVH